MPGLPDISLSRAQHALLLGVLLPISLIVLSLKVLRLLDASPGLLASLDLFASDLLFATSLIALALAWAGRLSRRPLLAMLPAQLLFIFWLQIELIAYIFYLIAGSTLDWPLIQLYLDYISTLWQMVVTSPPPAANAALIAFLLFFLLFPLRLLKRAPDLPADPRLTRGALLLAAIALPLSFVTPLFQSDTRLGHNASVELLATGANSFYINNFKARNSVHKLPAKLVPRPHTTPKNILLVVLESTGWRATTLARPERATTPNLQQLSRDALVFEQAHAVIPHTSKALVSIHCGVSPNLDIPITEATHQGIPRPCLPELLAAQGYATGFFQSATILFENRHALVKNFGYAHHLGAEDLEPTPFEQNSYFGYEERSLLEPTRNWLKENGKSTPFLLTVLTLSAHHDYGVPGGFLGEFHPDPHINRYLSSVSYVDTFLGELLAMLKEEGHGEDTLIVIVGDHGEAFGEHGRYQHDNVIYQEGLHIPMLIAGPGVAPARVSAPTSQLDLLPTLVHYAGFSLEGSYQGLDLSVEENRTTRRKHYAYCWYDRRCAATLDFPLKLVHHFDERPDQLFDLQHDPLEQHDLSAQQPDRARDMRRDLEAWLTQTHGAYHVPD